MKKSYVILIIFAFIVSSAFTKNTFAFGGLFNNKKFADHTYVGPFDISNNKTKQANSKLSSDLSELHAKLEVNLIYQDIQFPLPPETVKFDIDMSLANANSGEDNPIMAIVSREGLETVLDQELPWIRLTQEVVNSIAAGIEQELQTGIMPRNVYITDYIGANVVPDEIVASSEYNIDAISPPLSKAIHALNGAVIQPYTSFSMMELLTSAEVGPLTDEEMTLLSSTLYRAILQTNFEIDERNISPALISDIQPGFEAAMNQALGLDFKFTNPNKTEFTIRSAWSAGAKQISIEGMPFYYTYEPTVADVETYQPRTIRQYSAFVTDGQVIVSQEGKDGVEAVLKRTMSVNGQVVDTEDISEDFYAPIHRIEIHRLSKGNVTDSTNVEETDTTPNAGMDAEPGTGTTNTETGTTNSGKPDSAGSETSNQADDQQTSNEEEVIYDKSGLPIVK